MHIALYIVLALGLNTPSLANPSGEDMAARTEARARAIGHSLRCVVCQNQSIEESDASLAKDMRQLVRTHISQGHSDEDVIAFMRERYGDYVLLKPPVQANTYVLWFGPFIFLIIMFLGLSISGAAPRAYAPQWR